MTEKLLLYKRLRNVFIWAYVVGLFIATVTIPSLNLPETVMILMFLAVLALNFIGCYFWLKVKNRSYWFLPIALFGWFGWIVLSILKNKATDSTEARKQAVLKEIRG